MFALRPSFSTASLVSVLESSRWGVLVDSRGWLVGPTHLDEQDVSAGFGEGDGDGLADAARAARHGGGVALEGEERGGHSGSF